MIAKKIFLLSVLIGFLFAGCDKEIFRENFKIRVNEKVQTNNDPIKFSIIEIIDSRCPSDVVCVWQGKADVKLEIESPQKATLTLNTFDNLIDTFANYSFKLIDVSPYPISTENITLEDYIVSLEIEHITQND